MYWQYRGPPLLFHNCVGRHDDDDDDDDDDDIHRDRGETHVIIENEMEFVSNDHDRWTRTLWSTSILYCLFIRHFLVVFIRATSRRVFSRRGAPVFCHINRHLITSIDVWCWEQSIQACGSFFFVLRWSESVCGLSSWISVFVCSWCEKQKELI